MYDLWLLGVCIVTMICLSVIDIRTKRVPICGIIVLGIWAIINSLFIVHREYMDIFIAMIPGLLFVVISIFSKGRIGLGDGIIILILGVGAGLEQSMYILMLALLTNCIFAGVMMLLHRVNRNTKIPFIPFLTLGIGITKLCIN